MKITFIFVILLHSISLYAKGWGKYEYKAYKAISPVVFKALNLELGSLDFKAVYQSNRVQATASGFNQIFFDTFLNSAIYIKYDVGGNPVHNKILYSGKNAIYHFQDSQKKSYALSFVNIKKEKIKSLIGKIKYIVSHAKFVNYKQKFLSIFQSKAYANDQILRSIEYTSCINKSQLQISETSEVEDIAANTGSAVLMNCFHEIGDGAKGAAVDLYNLGNMIYSSVAEISLSKIVGITKSFASGVVMVAQAMNGNFGPLLSRIAGPFQEVFMAIKEDIKNLTPAQAFSFFCNMLGSLGFDVLLGLLTGGAIHIVNPLGIVNKVKRLTNKFFAMLGKEPPKLFRKKEYVFDPNSTPKGLGVLSLDHLDKDDLFPTSMQGIDASPYKLLNKAVDTRHSYNDLRLKSKNDREMLEKALIEKGYLPDTEELAKEVDRLARQRYSQLYKKQHNSLILEMQNEYNSHNISTNIKVNSNGLNYLEIDVKNISRESSFGKFLGEYQKLYPSLNLDKKIVIDIDEAINSNAYGYYSSKSKVVDIGIESYESAGMNWLDSVMKHELRHAAFAERRRQGIESPFDLLVFSSNGQGIKAKKQFNDGLNQDLGSYKHRFSAEEIYNHSKMIRDYRKLADNLMRKGDLEKAKLLIRSKLQDTLKTTRALAEAIVYNAQDSMASLKKIQRELDDAKHTDSKMQKFALERFESQIFDIQSQRLTIAGDAVTIISPVVNKALKKKLQKYHKLKNDKKIELLQEIVEVTRMKQERLLTVATEQSNLSNNAINAIKNKIDKDGNLSTTEEGVKVLDKEIARKLDKVSHLSYEIDPEAVRLQNIERRARDNE